MSARHPAVILHPWLEPSRRLVDLPRQNGAELVGKALEALGLPISEGGVGVFAGARQARVDRTVVPEMEIGGIRIRNVPAGINSSADGLNLPGVKLDGVIGTGLLMHFLSTIDYCSGKLTLAPRGASSAFQARAGTSGANVVPFWLVAAFAGWRGMVGVWPAILVAGVPFAVLQFLISNLHGPWLVDVVASIGSMAALVLFLRLWRPRDGWAPGDRVGSPADRATPPERRDVIRASCSRREGSWPRHGCA